MVMFDFKVTVNEDLVFEDTNPRTIIEKIFIEDLNGGVLAEVAVAGKAGVNLRFQTASLANRPYQYLSIINSDEWKKVCEEYDNVGKEETEPSDQVIL